MPAQCALCACSSMSLSQLVETGMSYSKEVRLLTNGRLFQSKPSKNETNPKVILSYNT